MYYVLLEQLEQLQLDKQSGKIDDDTYRTLGSDLVKLIRNTGIKQNKLSPEKISEDIALTIPKKTVQRKSSKKCTGVKRK